MSLRDRVKQLFAGTPRRDASPSPPMPPDPLASKETEEPAGHPVDHPVRSGLHPRLLSAGVGFGLRLHRQLAGERPRDNLVLCPVSIGLTLAMAANASLWVSSV